LDGDYYQVNSRFVLVGIVAMENGQGIIQVDDTIQCLQFAGKVPDQHASDRENRRRMLLKRLPPKMSTTHQEDGEAYLLPFPIEKCRVV